MTSEIIATIANVALALSVVVALVFGIAQVHAAERERLTLENLRNFQSHEFAELIYYVITSTIPSSQKELHELPPTQQIAFIQLAQQMESLGILVAEGFIDLDLVDKTLGSFVTTSWDKYKIFVFAMRDSDPYLNEYFQWLAERIDERMRNNPREPVYTTYATHDMTEIHR